MRLRCITVVRVLLQKYIATASVAYQREIVRLSTALKQHGLDPGAVKP